MWTRDQIKGRRDWVNSEQRTENESVVTQVFLTLCNSMACSAPGSSVHEILQAGILEQVAIPSSRGSSRPRVKPGSPALQVDSLLSVPPGKTKQGTRKWKVNVLFSEGGYALLVDTLFLVTQETRGLVCKWKFPSFFYKRETYALISGRKLKTESSSCVCLNSLQLT